MTLHALLGHATTAALRALFAAIDVTRRFVGEEDG